ncbi:MAG TPA: hypothetical protein VKA49_02490 [Flavitalea sp.]|nr:hypothetical protein [Flavitalea sp.]
MKNLSVVTIIAFYILSIVACKKSTMPPAPSANNEMNATVAIAGAAPISHKASNYHVYIPRTVGSNGETYISISGNVGTPNTTSERSITIVLFNISATGTYAFNMDPNARQQAYCTYEIGNIFSYIYNQYSTETVAQAGSVTITAITATSIQGTFTANCDNYAIISNGTFKGDFEK